jgi:exo-1,4-beta-D-glucosaminidase
VPNVESLRKMLPPESLWPIDAVWNYHAGGEHFATLDSHTQALTARYGAARSVDDYALKAQVLAYESERAMFEANRARKGASTGVIAWMLNSAWPSLMWHLYDYYLAAGGGYYGVKKGNEPLHIQFSYDDRSVAVVNDTGSAARGLAAAAELFDQHGKKLLARTAANLTIPTDKSVVALTLPQPEGVSATSFVRLSLRDAKKRLVSENFYWLATTPDELDYAKSEWWGTPILKYASFSALAALATVTPTATIHDDGAAPERTIRVTIENRSAEPAFFVRLRVTRGEGGGEVLPSLWSDNYVSLLPGERRELSARFSAAALGGASPVVVLSGWNVPEKALSPHTQTTQSKPTRRGREPAVLAIIVNPPSNLPVDTNPLFINNTCTAHTY